MHVEITRHFEIYGVVKKYYLQHILNYNVHFIVPFEEGTLIGKGCFRSNSDFRNLRS